MSNYGPKTTKNLHDAFAGESMARNKYSYFASVARKAGFIQIANIFEETANNEKEHAKLWAKALGLIGETADNLKAAADGESHEYQSMYPQMAQEAEEEGHPDLAVAFREVADVEEAHEKRYRKLLANLENGTTFKREQPVRWKCNNCGYVHEGPEAPTECPACHHPQGYFELMVETY
ncbi:MAG TPA: rubrerythrin family protein [bacterium]|nr:rubrerythrin family protein [bacterium]